MASLGRRRPGGHVIIRVTHDRNTDWKGLEAITRARYMWRAALAAAAPDTTRVVFERAVRRDVERMLEEGAPVSAIAAFQSAAAELQTPMEPEAYKFEKSAPMSSAQQRGEGPPKKTPHHE